MIGSLLWKEYREQRAVCLALALLAVLILIPAVLISAPEGIHTQRYLGENLAVIALVLAWTQGLVSGAMLLAGETEAGTAGFLHTLPGQRRIVWWAKFLAGLGYVLAQIGWLAVLSVALGLFEKQDLFLAEGLGLLLAGLFGFGWGLFGSVIGRTVLGGIGLALGLQMAILPLCILMCVVLLFPLSVYWDDHVFRAVPFMVMGVMLVGPFLASALLYTQPDWSRRAPATASTLPRLLAGWRQLFWLAWRQLGGFGAGILAFALLAGVVLPAQGLILWPIFTLALGVVCGATAFLDEQQSGSFRFLGEQRFPLGKVWLVKVGLRLALAGLAAILVFLPALAAIWYVALWAPPWEREEFLSRILGAPQLYRVIPPILFLVMWLIHGFAVGQLCGLLFRNALVAIVVGWGLAALLAGVWVPSLLGGGLFAWQALSVPVVLLIAGRWLLHPWVNGRLVSFRVIAGMVGVAILCGLLIAGGLWYRVVEVPDVPLPEPLAEHLKELPAPEKNDAGQLIRPACRQVEHLIQAQGPRGQELYNRAVKADRQGWPAHDAELNGWLDTLFKDDWADKLARAADLPVGVVVDPRQMTLATPEPVIQSSRAAGALLGVRGLQLHARGDPASFVRFLRIGLTLGRNLQQHSPEMVVLASKSIEEGLLVDVERWLERLDGQPDLLRQALKVVQDHLANTPMSEADHRWAEYIVLLNSLDDPQAWTLGTRSLSIDSPLLGLFQFAWATPWERERHLRTARVLAWGSSDQVWRMWNRINRVPSGFPDSRRRLLWMDHRLVRFRATILMLSLRLYQAEQGQPAPNLVALVPRYLSAIPADPFDEQPFRYRLSQGEKIPWPTEEPARFRLVPAGQGILWSVGEDHVDHGARLHSPRAQRDQGGADIIFLVPLPPKKPH
jgi:ABC-type transport system involved in multi-copper enzyme maturation permease subunit